MKDKKSIFAMILVFVFSIPAFTQQYNKESDFKAQPLLDGKSVMITEYIGSQWTVNIPPKIQQLPVTVIGKNAFQDKKLISVTIPNGITLIMERAFMSNLLTSIIIPNSVTSIGDNAFCANNLTSINIPKSVTSIGRFVFVGNPKMSRINVSPENLKFCSKEGYCII